MTGTITILFMQATIFLQLPLKPERSSGLRNRNGQVCLQADPGDQRDRRPADRSCLPAALGNEENGDHRGDCPGDRFPLRCQALPRGMQHRREEGGYGGGHPRSR